VRSPPLMSADPSPPAGGAALTGAGADPAAIGASGTGGRWARWRSAWPSPGEVGFALVGLPLALMGVAYVAAMLYVGGLLALTIVGLPLVAVLLAGTRAIGGFHRWLVERLLQAPIAAPPPVGEVRQGGGALRWVGNHLVDAAAWRSVLYLLVRLPVAALTFVAGVATWVYGLFALVLPFLAPTVMDQDFSVSLLVQGLAVGGVLLALAPWATRVTADLNRWLARALLGAAPPSPRLRALERARSEVASDAAATLRRIERDLHDGTQARLVAIAVSLTMADQALDTGDPDRAQELVARARAQLDEATVELRQLTRGINPVALDGGLVEALPTLAADAGIATDLDVDLPERPSPVIERVVYFCVAELLSNAAKHSGADSAQVEVATVAGRLRLRVRDQGQGGAVRGAGSGLQGLRDRLAAVDGTLAISSPRGGPTVVTADLPTEL
jgi:signal transduction histidine kinase